MHTPQGDRDLANLRVIIVGGPKTGKTTLANEIGGTVFHTDDLIGTHSWEDVPNAIIDWMGRPGSWVIEGVQTARALRRWLKLQPLIGILERNPPVDQIIVKTHPFVELAPRQEGLLKGVMTVWREVEPLLGSAVDVVYW